LVKKVQVLVALPLRSYKETGENFLSLRFMKAWFFIAVVKQWCRFAPYTNIFQNTPPFDKGFIKWNLLHSSFEYLNSWRNKLQSTLIGHKITHWLVFLKGILLPFSSWKGRGDKLLRQVPVSTLLMLKITISSTNYHVNGISGKQKLGSRTCLPVTVILSFKNRMCEEATYGHPVHRPVARI